MNTLGSRLVGRGGAGLIAAALVAYLGAVGLGDALGVNVWHLFGVPADVQVKFLDLRAITSAWDCARRGLDPLVADPCDPLLRPMNYPRIWLQVGLLLHLSSAATIPIGIAFAAVYVAAMSAIASWLPANRAWLLLPFVLSPTWMTAVERGNNDIVVLGLLTAAALLGHGKTRLREAACLVCAIAAAIKIYPIVGLAAWSRMRITPWILAMASLVAGYFLVTFPDLQLIAAGTPEPTTFAFGARILELRLVSFRQLSSTSAVAVTIVAVLLLALAGVALSRRLRSLDTAEPARPVVRLAFRIGALIYLGVFVANSNFAYRLILLALTLPMLIVRSTSLNPAQRRFAKVTLGVTLALSWGLRVAAVWPLTAALAAVLFVLMLAQCIAEFFPTRSSWASSIDPTEYRSRAELVMASDRAENLP